MLFAVTGNTDLLQDNPAFARSLLTRTPYIDPLNHLQVVAVGTPPCRRQQRTG